MAYYRKASTPTENIALWVGAFVAFTQIFCAGAVCDFCTLLGSLAIAGGLATIVRGQWWVSTFVGIAIVAAGCETLRGPWSFVAIVVILSGLVGGYISVELFYLITKRKRVPRQ